MIKSILCLKILLVSILFLMFAGCTDNSGNSGDTSNEEILRHITVMTEKIDDLSRDVNSLQEDVAEIQGKVSGTGNTVNVQPPEEPLEKTVGNFIISKDDPCPKDGKPVVYMFTSETCGYCKWEKPVMANTTELFEDEITYINVEGSYTPEQRAIFNKYNPKNSVPTIVLNCEYYRVGAGSSRGYEVEANDLTQLICDLTGNKPSDVCSDYV